MKKIMTIALLALLSACETATTDYDANRDFSALHHYAWTQATAALAYGDTPINDALYDQRVREAVEAVMAEKGLQKTDAASAEILISYRLVTREKLNANSTRVGVGMYGPPGVAMGTSVTVSQYKETELFIDMIDAHTAVLVWRGSVEYSTRENQSPEERKEEIYEKVADILAEFPPK